MKNIFLAILFFIALKIHAQTITGQILESGTNKPVANAIIYFDGSFQGTSSDNQGNFTLRTTINNKVPLIVSSIGYTTISIANYSADKKLLVHLEIKSIQLKEVTVGYDGMSREDKLKIFRREFLGTSENGMECLIENEDDIYFTYDKSEYRLDAFSDNPILIYNRSLGYRVKYFLNNFTSLPNATAYNGNAFFEEDISIKGREYNRIIRRREATYNMSRMRFIRAIWANTLDKTPFKVFDIYNKKLDSESLIEIRDGQKYLHLKQPVKVYYRQGESYILQKNPQTYTYIDKTGFFEASEITWRAELAQERVGDLLPFEYNPDISK